MTSQIDEDTIDDILYFARANELEDLTSFLQETASKLKLSQADVLAQAVDAHTGNTALHYSSANGHLDLIKSLLPLFTSDSIELKAYVNHQNQSGNTPLHWAALNGHLEIVKLLLINSADASILNQSGHDAVFEAEMNDKQAVAEYLLKEALGLEKPVGGEDADEPGRDEDEEMADVEGGTDAPGLANGD